MVSVAVDEPRPRIHHATMSRERIGGVIMVGAVLALGILPGQCAPGPGEAAAAASAMGFRDVTVTDTTRIGVTFTACSKSDMVAHDVSGTNPTGQRVKLTVCCGWPFKGCTVRARGDQ
jgi:hypothetical protein